MMQVEITGITPRGITIWKTEFDAKSFADIERVVLKDKPTRVVRLMIDIALPESTP